SERSELADAVQTVAAMRPGVRDHERVTGRRYVVQRRQPRAVPPGLSADRAVALAGAGEMDDPGLRRPVLHQTDADAPGREAGDPSMGSTKNRPSPLPSTTVPSSPTMPTPGHCAASAEAM